MTITREVDVVVLGAGVSGLASADELTKNGKRVVVIEKSEGVGGLAATKNYLGFSFDLSPHRWFSKNKELNEWFKKLVGDEVLEINRNTAIFRDNKFYQYPLELGDLIKKFGMLESFLAALSYGISKFKYRGVVTKNMEDEYIKDFGKYLYQKFNKDYNEKLWGKDCCRLMSKDFVSQRVRGMNLMSVIKDMVGNSGVKPVSLVERFMYPKNGIGTLSINLKKRIEDGGGEIRYKMEVQKISKVFGGYKVLLMNGETYKTKSIISSIPIYSLVESLGIKSNKVLVNKIKKIKYLSQKIVVILVRRAQIFNYNWIYVHPLDLPFFRVMDMSTWSKDMSPTNTTSLIFEFSERVKDVNRMSDQRIVNETIESLNKMIILSRGKTLEDKDVLGCRVIEVKSAYPIYDLGYKKRVNSVIRTIETSYPGIQLIGRNGRFRYNNMDHSIYTGILAAKNFLAGKNIYDLDAVNSDAAYMEEGEGTCPKISAVVMTHNNANIVDKCLRSLRWCDELVVIDDDSSDMSREVAEKYGAKVFKRSIKGDFASQRNFAYEVVKNDWILFVDSDEIVTDKLKQEIVQYFCEKTTGDISAFWFRREDYFLGKLLKHGPAGRAYFGRLVRKNRTKWVGEIFEYPKVEGESIYLNERLIHNRQEKIEDLVKKANFYSDLEAEMLYKAGVKPEIRMIVWDPIMRFFDYYIGKKAFLDGMAGFIFVILGSVLVKFLGQVKLWVKWNS